MKKTYSFVSFLKEQPVKSPMHKIAARNSPIKFAAEDFMVRTSSLLSDKGQKNSALILTQTESG